METVMLASSIRTALPILFLVMVVIFVYFAITFIHHWGYYSFNNKIKRIAQSTYIVVSLLILVALAFFIGIYMFR